MQDFVIVHIPKDVRHIADAAAAWANSAHHDVDVVLDEDRALLRSGIRSKENLETIWLAAIANQLLFSRFEHDRAELLESLFA